jgi:hypothetical protein
VTEAEFRLPWGAYGVTSDACALWLIYEGSPNVRAQRALVTELPNSVRVDLVTGDRVGRSSIECVCAVVALAAPVGDRAVLGGSSSAWECVGLAGPGGLSGLELHSVDAPAGRARPTHLDRNVAWRVVARRTS